MSARGAISDVNATSRELARFKALYSMLAEINQAVTSAPDRSQLFTDVCRIAVERGGFKFAWIGLIQTDGRVVPEARHGEDFGYIDSVDASIDPDDARSAGPIGRSIRTGQHAVTDDFSSDPDMSPWRNKAIEAGVGAVASFPVRQDGELIGALVLYAAEPGFFSAHELTTLDEIAADICLGIDAIERVGRRSAAAAEAREWFERLEQYFEASPSISYACLKKNGKWHTEWISPNIRRILGFTVGEAKADGWWEANLHPEDLTRVISESSSAVTGGALRHEYRFLRADGEEIWVLDDLRFIPADESSEGSIVGTWTNFTERRRAEQSLRESEERLRLALSAAQQGLYDLDLSTGNAVVTDEYAKMLGYDPVSYQESDERWRERLHPDDRMSVTKVFDDYVAGRIPDYRVEFRERRKDGKWIWILSVGRIVSRSADGTPLRMLGSHTDISILKENEFQLSLRARVAQALLELPAAAARLSEPDFFRHVLDLIEDLTDSGIAFIHILGADEENIQAVSWSTRTTTDCPTFTESRAPVSEAGVWANALRTLAPFVCNDYEWNVGNRGTPDDHPVLHRVVTVPVIDNDRIRMVTGIGNKPDDYTATDVETVQLLGEEAWRISQRRRSEVARQKSDRFRTLIFEHLAEGVIAADDTGRLILVNKAAREWQGVTHDGNMDPAELAEWYDLYDEAGETPLARERNPLFRAIRGETIRDATVSIVPSNGSIRQVVANGGPVLTESGRQIGSIVVMHDVSAQREAESELRLRSAALEAAGDAVLITDRMGTIEWANAAFTAMTGYELSEAMGRNPRELVRSGVQDQAFYALMWQTVLAGNVWRGEITNRRKDGSRYPEALSITPVRDEAGEIRHFIAIKRDLTEEHALQANFLQAQKMESVGRLAGGLAHDFNNLLTVINGFVDLALPSVRDDDPLHADLVEVRKAGERASDLTRQMLAFSRKQILHSESIDLNALISDLTRMLSRLIGDDIVLETRLADNVGPIAADRSQLEQVIVNLAVNARDAMQTGGTLTIETLETAVDDANADASASLPRGRYVLLRIIDTGIGMDDATRAHLFEPFFTTKEQGKGTGLGLSIVYGIVKQSGGSVQVESQPGRGTVFEILLPRSDQQAAARPGRARQTRTVNASVLVVDDQPVLTAVAARILKRAGYDVHTAGSGVEALDLVENRGRRFDLLMTDVVMPGMSGPDLAQRIQTRLPTLKVLFTSGYTDDMVIRHGVNEATMDFIGKPYSIEALTSKVAEVLSKEDG